MAIPRILKWMLWSAGSISVLLVVMIILLAWFFSDLIGEPSKDEVSRVISPSGMVDAVPLETNGGATTSFGYQINVVEHGAQPTGFPALFLYGAVRSEHAYGANLKWNSPRSLAIAFLRAKSKNIPRSSVSIDGQSIQLIVHEGVSDQSAPLGGMLYNLRGRERPGT